MTWIVHVLLIIVLTATGPDSLLVIACGLLLARAILLPITTNRTLTERDPS